MCGPSQYEGDECLAKRKSLSPAFWNFKRAFLSGKINFKEN